MKLRNAQSHLIQPERAHEALDGVLVADMVEALSQTGRQATDEEWNVADFRLSPLVERRLHDKT
jgi:hypothetical protein